MKRITALEAEKIVGQRVNPEREYFAKEGRLFVQLRFADMRVLWTPEPEFEWSEDKPKRK